MEVSNPWGYLQLSSIFTGFSIINQLLGYPDDYGNLQPYP
jgi:hypothetical protein